MSKNKLEIFSVNKFLEIMNRKDMAIGCGDTKITLDYAVEISTTILNELIESWPVVYGFEGKGWGPDTDGGDTHKARLAFIEEIPKEECKHLIKEFSVEHEKTFLDLSDMNNVKRYGTGLPQVTGNCKHCGKKLKAKWELDDV